MRYRFWDLFEETSPGRLVPRRTLEINGKRLDPGAPIAARGSVAGVRMDEIVGRDLEGYERRGVVRVYGFCRHASADFGHRASRAGSDRRD